MEKQGEVRPDWSITGTAKSSGGVFDRVRIRGEADASGDVECNQLKLMGTLSVSGDLKSKTTKIMGTARVAGDVNGEEIRILGELTVGGDCNAESFRSRGAFQIDGLLNAGDVDISLYGTSFAREIGGDRIHVKPHRHFFSTGVRRLTVDTVEGDVIRLENTSARVVRGSSVDIGPGCEIELIEYKTSLRQDDRSKVDQKVKV